MATVPSSSPPPIHPAEVGCGLAGLGLILGGICWMALIATDPFGCFYFPEPPGVDIAQARAAYHQWKGSPRVVIGSAAMTAIPLLVSGACGVFVRRHWPRPLARALLRLLGVVAALLLASEVGTRAVDRALSTGESSDLQSPFGMLAFQGLCIAPAAPLSRLATRRRARPVRGRPTRRG